MNAPSTGKSAANIRSMTGYAQAQIEKDGWLLRVSLRSVNHRFLDLRVRVPEGFDVFEPRIRQMLRDGVRRGHVDVTVNFESTAATSTEIHRSVAENYLRAVEELRRDFALTAEPDLVALMRLPGVVGSGSSGSHLTQEEIERLDDSLRACLQEALQRLQEMRAVEGASLAAEMRGLLASIATQIVDLEALTERSRP